MEVFLVGAVIKTVGSRRLDSNDSGLHYASLYPTALKQSSFVVLCNLEASYIDFGGIGLPHHASELLKKCR